MKIEELGPDVWLYQSIFSESFCQKMIDKYEVSDKAYVANRSSTGPRVYRYGEVIDITQNDDWSELRSELITGLDKCYDDHINRIMGQDPFSHEYLALEVCSYKPPNGYCEIHFDGFPGVYPVLMTMVVYLNTMQKGEGGETYFPRWELTIRPQVGGVLLFPPHYTHLHGAFAVTKSRYFVNSRVIERGNKSKMRTT